MRITWDSFASVNEDATSSFESLCSIIFSDIIGVKVQQIPKNYPGLEARPLKNRSKKMCSYQAKFFRKEDATAQRSQIKDSLKAISDKDLKSLKVLYIFINEAAAGVETDSETFWANYLAKKKVSHIKIVWRYGIDFFLNYLRDEKFEGIASMFFGQGRPIKMHEANYSDKYLAVRKEDYYLDLPVEHNAKKSSIRKIVNDTAKYILIQSRAGTGKSWLMNELAYRIAGSNLSYKQQQLRVYEKGIVVHTTAYECTKASVLNVLTGRLTGYGIKPFDYKITLLIDAVDEIEKELVQPLTDELNRLSRSGHIDRVILTSRIASLNGAIVATILKPQAYEITELDETYILDYFTKRKNQRKIALIKRAIKERNDLTAIKNVRMLEIAWSIATTTDDFSLENMFEKRLLSQIDKLRPKDINLLEPIANSVESILKKQAFELQKKEIFDFSLSELQGVVLDKFSRLNYRDTNSIIKFLETICLDATGTGLGRLQFEHRSWVDYFTARYLAEKFDNHEKLLLVDFAAYEDLLIRWFIPVARKMYISQGKTISAIALGVVEWYAKEDWVSWVDKDSELICDISIAKYNPSLTEYTSSMVRKSQQLAVIRKAYDCGLAAQATYAYEKLRTQLETSDNIEHNIWQDFVDFYYLTIKIRNKPPILALTDLQNIVKLNIDKKSRRALNSDDYAKKLVLLSEEVMALGVTTEEIIKTIDPDLYSYFINFLILPDSIRFLRRDSELKEQITTALEDEDSLVLKGLIEDDWDSSAKQEAKDLLKKLNEEQYRRDTYPVAHNIRRLSMLRTLSYWSYDAIDNYTDDPHHHVLTLNEVFHNLYALIVLGGYNSQDLSKFAIWIEEAKYHIYAGSDREESSTKRAISSILHLIVRNAPIGISRQVLNSLTTESETLYSDYDLMLSVFADDEDVFRKLFSYEDVKSVLDKSRDDPYDQQTTLSRMSSIIGMYSQQDLLAYVSNAKKDSRLKYGYRKDTIGFFLVKALKSAIEDGFYSDSEIKAYTWRILKIILRILDITDGKETRWLPDRLFNILIDYDMSFADEVYTKYIEDYPYDDYSVRTIIITGAIHRGDAYSSITKRMQAYIPTMLEPGRTTPAYYEEQIVCLAEVLKSPSYSSENKEDALNQMSDFLTRLIKEARNTRWSYKPDSFSDELREAAKIYRQYKSKSPIKAELSPFPTASKQNNGLGESYELEKKLAEKAAKNALKNADSKEAVLKLVTDHMDNGYGYLVRDKVGSRIFVAKLEQWNIPYEEIDKYITRSLDQYHHGTGAINFAIAAWNSTYRSNMTERFVSSSHYSDLESIFQLLREDKDWNSIHRMIEHITELIEVLTRKESGSLG